MDGIFDWIGQALSQDTAWVAAIMVPVIFLAESIWPARPISRRHYWFGSIFCFLNVLIMLILAPLISFGTAVGISKLGFGLIDLSGTGFGGAAGTVVALLVSTAVIDLFQYWYHRLLHFAPILWQIHVVHHSDQAMNVTTTHRSHFFEQLILPFFITLPMAFLFKLPPVTIAAVSLIPYAYLFVTHANVRLGFGPLWWVLVSPDYHRIHHSIEFRHRDKNFADWFPIWDIVFGTAWRPLPDECPETGVDGVRISTISAAYLNPLFGWRQLAADRERRKHETSEPGKTA